MATPHRLRHSGDALDRYWPSSNAEATRATGEAGVEYQPATGYRFVEVLELRSRGAGSGQQGQLSRTSSR